jgi:small subunit ribosomal protein S6
LAAFADAKDNQEDEMPVYETVFMARQDLTETQVKDLADGFCKILKDNGASVLKTEHWGLRNLAYVINKSRKAQYVLIESDGPGAALIELERNLRLNEDVIRSLSVKLDAPTEKPSAIIDRNRSYDQNEKEAA